MTLTVMPSCEAILSLYLKAHGQVGALVGNNVYSTTPKDPLSRMPMIRMTRIGGDPPLTRPLWIDKCWLQVDCFGGDKNESETLAHTARAAITEEFPGVQDQIVVSDVTAGGLIYQPDETYSPPKPRYLFDVVITLHPVTP